MAAIVRISECYPNYFGFTLQCRLNGSFPIQFFRFRLSSSVQPILGACACGLEFVNVCTMKATNTSWIAILEGLREVFCCWNEDLKVEGLEEKKDSRHHDQSLDPSLCIRIAGKIYRHHDQSLDPSLRMCSMG